MTDMTRTRRAYALPLVLIFLTILAVSCIAALVALQLSTQSTAAVIGRRQAFYECDNVTRVASAVARAYLRSTAAPTDADLKLAVCGAVATCPSATGYTDPAFSVDTMTVQLAAAQFVGGIPNGPFQGVVARQNDVAIDVELTKNATGDRCHVRQDSTVAEVKLPAFFVLVDGYGDFHPEAALTLDGRIHVNGDACVRPSGAGNLTIERITAGGRLHASACPRAAPAAGVGVTNIRDAATTAPVLIDSTMDSGCLGCGASALDWRAFALQRWTGNAQDVDHGVPQLRLPASSSVAVPNGRDAAGAVSSNAQSMRFLIDPARSTDSADVKAARLAWQADIRILNGVWYKKDSGDPDAWPGIPIWSDHPVAFTTLNDGGLEGAQPVGQPAYAGLPSRYSYYQYDAGLQTLRAINWASVPVVSYGALAQDAGRLRPAMPLAACPAPGAGVAPISTDACRSDAEQLLLGARAGFVDPRAAQSGAARGKILPINFDVEAFAAALADGGAGELGSHVPAATFNGIVWIGTSWNGAHTTGAVPTAWPVVDGPSDPNVFDTTLLGGATVNALPYPLCGTSANALAAGSRIPPCNLVTRPNAVRIINAADLSPFAATGLTIATNGPMVLQGDFGAPGGGAPNATQAALMADALTVLSPGFNDGAHGFDVGATLTAATGDVAIAAAVFVGNVEAAGGAAGGGIENTPRLMEDWTGRTFTVQGSVAVGFRSVFATQPANAALFVAPTRVWRHDPGFKDPTLFPLGVPQSPPGMPSLFVQAVKNWQRE